MKKEIQKLIEKAIKNLKYEAVEVVVDYPKNEAFGDYTTNVAMVLGRTLKKNPLEIAEKIIEIFEKLGTGRDLSVQKDVFEKIEIIKPGYVNFYLSKKYLQDKVAEINELKENYGDSKIGENIKVNNEFISANPTGPLHLGNGRGGFLGDAISNILKKNGFEVRNEYYVNDAGEQVVKLGHSVLKDSEAVYAGEYIDELNKKFGKIKDAKEAGEKSAEIILQEIIAPMVEKKMGISGMNYMSERDLYSSGKVDKALGILKKKKLTYEKDDALWLKTNKFGDDKDRVLIKKDKQKTYFASDCGYILYKIEKGFDRIIEIWGADHHGYISRFRAAAKALGFKKELKFIIVQLVRLTKDGKEARMSKRAGNVVYIDELIGKVGLDVARFFFLMYSPDTHMTFDLNMAMEKSEKNPVYYVQYAHARICSILEKYEKTLTPTLSREQARGNANEIKEEPDLSLLTQEKELNLIRELNKFPELVSQIAESYEVHRLPYYAITLADKFHSFYNDLKVIDLSEPEMTRARLELAKSVRIVLAEVLRLIGVSAPERM